MLNINIVNVIMCSYYENGRQFGVKCLLFNLNDLIQEKIIKCNYMLQFYVSSCCYWMNRWNLLEFTVFNEAMSYIIKL